MSNTKTPAWYFNLASLLDRGMQRVDWLKPRTIVCFIKLYFGAVQLSIVSPTECLGRICFPGLIYCDRTWVLFLGVHIRLLTGCKICLTLGLLNYFFLRSLSLCLKVTWMCPKVYWFVDYKFICHLNYEFINGSFAFSPG